MTDETTPDRPLLLSEHLKELDARQFSRQLPDFDLDGAIRGGQRRRRRRTAGRVVGAAAGVGLTVAAVLGGLGGLVGDPRHLISPVPATSVGIGDDSLTYLRRGDVVEVKRAGATLAVVTLSAATFDDEVGTVTVTVDAAAPLDLGADDFVWSGDEPDVGPAQPGKILDVQGTGPQTFSWTYNGVGPGTLVWAPTGAGRIAGIWDVEGNRTPTAAAIQAGRTRYLQRGTTVTVYTGDQATADLTVVSTEQLTGRARVGVDVHADRAFRLHLGDFICEDSTGDDHPVRSRTADLSPGQTRHLVLTCTGTLSDVLWDPGQNDFPAGVWLMR